MTGCNRMERPLVPPADGGSPQNPMDGFTRRENTRPDGTRVIEWLSPLALHHEAEADAERDRQLRAARLGLSIRAGPGPAPASDWVQEAEPSPAQRAAAATAFAHFLAEYRVAMPGLLWTWYRRGDGPADAAGYCVRLPDACFGIGICVDQSAEEVYRTVIHECAHAIDSWQGDREARAYHVEAQFDQDARVFAE